ncbi:hypothetical protein Tco_1446216, partial [Tanacetum coccineum]
FRTPNVIISDNGKKFAEGIFPVFYQKLSKTSLEYGSEAVFPIEISVETKRIKDFKARQNEKKRREDLDILEERREIASIRETYYKQKLEGYYNKRVQPSTFK